MTRIRTLMAVVLALLVPFALAACGGSDSESSSSTSAAGAEQQATGDKKAPGDRTIGVLPIALASEYVAAQVDHFKQALEPLGWDTVVVDGAADPQQIENGMQQLVNQKVDAIVTISLGGEEAPRGFKAASDAGIPLIAMSTGPNPANYAMWDAIIADDPKKMGEITGQYIADGPTEAPVVGVDVTQNYSGHAYVEGVQSVLAEGGLEYTDLRDTELTDIVNSIREQASAVIQKNQGDLTFVEFSDYGAPIILPVISSAGRQDEITLITRYDNPSTLELARKNPNLLINAINSPIYITKTVDALLAHLVDGDPLPAEPYTATEGKVYSSQDLPEGDVIYPFDPILERALEGWKRKYLIGPA